MKIGILGGSFDPIHKAHLKIATLAKRKFKLDKIIFIPAYIAPHKKSLALASPRDRMQMIKLAIEKDRQFEVSDIEIRRKGVSYTYKTINYLRRKFGKKVKLYFIIGEDMLEILHHWYKVKEILKEINFIIVARTKRPTETLQNVSRHFDKDIIEKLRKNLIKIKPISISSTQIRDNIRKGKDCRKLLPRKVYDYIIEHNLYQR